MSSCAECGSARRHRKTCTKSKSNLIEVSPVILGKVNKMDLRDHILKIYRSYAEDDRVPTFNQVYVLTGANVRDLEIQIAWLQKEGSIPRGLR